MMQTNRFIALSYRLRTAPRAIVALILLCLLVAPTPSAASAASDRQALIVANGGYKAERIPYASAQAERVEAALREAGFQVTVEHDLDLAGMEGAMDRFLTRRTEAGGIALIYFVGLAARLDGDNYLLPVNLDVSREYDIKYAGVEAALIVKQLSLSPASVGVLVLDVATNRPLGADAVTPSGVGLAMPRLGAAGEKVLVAMPAEPEAEIRPNDSYGQAFAKAMRTPGLTFKDVFQQVRVAIYEASEKERSPRDFGSLVTRVVLIEEAPAFASRGMGGPSTLGATAPAEAVADADPTETLFWQTAVDQADPDLVNAYLAKYPDGAYAEAAKELLASMRTDKADLERLFWEDIKDSRDPDDFQDYLDAYPKGEFAMLAEMLHAKYASAATSADRPVESGDAAVASAAAVAATAAAVSTRSLTPPVTAGTATPTQSASAVLEPTPLSAEARAWLVKGEAAFAANRLLTPESDAAVTWARKALDAAPGNTEALGLIGRVIDRYQGWASSQIKSRKLSKARGNLRKADSLAEYASEPQLARSKKLSRQLASRSTQARRRTVKRSSTPKSSPKKEEESSGFWGSIKKGFGNITSGSQ